MAKELPESGAARRAARKALKLEYARLYDELLRLLARHDPIALVALGAPEDEYAPEVGTILLRVLELQRSGQASLASIRKVVHEEFVHWFASHAVGTGERYMEIAAEILAILEGEPLDGRAQR